MNGIILAIETSGDGGGAALLRDGEVVAGVEVTGPRRHGAEIMPCVEQVCVDASIRRDDIDVIAVNCGPGSYTGLRIGLASASAIGHALKKPVVGVPCFDAMVLQYVLADDFDVNQKRELWPVLDARRDEVMTARFSFEAGVSSRAVDDHLIAPQLIHEGAAAQAIIFGSGVAPYADRFEKSQIVVDEREFALKASSVALQAWRQLDGVDDPASIERKLVQPRYFRRVLARTIEERAKQV